ncbi:AraC family transcriptional regulator [Bacillus sp. FJAT-27251]|uniref:AraC family transcriptional regulator n=1 Tax=Bacillus sp. FJAT-27251 TaxID=1684142 RepID=UPI0006A7EE9F|nr:AraC family transcriptional regulator [Bacillus sp. FJAT-27251]
MVFFEQHGMEEKESFQFSTLKNFTFPLHFHRAYELIIVNEGFLQVSIDQKDYMLTKNDAAFVFSNQMHDFKTADTSEITIILFSPELIGDFFMNYKGYIPENNVFHLTHLPDLETLRSIYRQKSFLYKICSLLVENTTFKQIEHSTKTKVLHKILLYVDQKYTEECTLKQVAKELQYDYAYLSKLFVQMTNMTFTDYLNHYRIFQACYLLKNSQQSISEIAVNCGYNNLRSFNRNFRNIMGDSPKGYRQR